MVDQGVDDLPEITGGLDTPGVQDQQGEPAVLFDGHLAQALTQCLAADVVRLVRDVADRVAEPFVDELVGLGAVSPVCFRDVFEALFHLCNPVSRSRPCGGRTRRGTRTVFTPPELSPHTCRGATSVGA